MPVIQPVFEISDKAMAGLLNDELIRHGGVIYHKTGGIFEHLKDVSAPEIPKAKVLSNKYLAIGLGVVLVTASAVGVIKLYNSNKARKKNVGSETHKCVEGYNDSLCAYLEAVHKGKLDVNTINRLVSDLDYLKENYNSGKLNIEFSVEQLDTLINLVFDYTRKLAEANSVDMSDVKEPVTASVDSTIIDFRRYLEVQKQIFEKVS